MGMLDMPGWRVTRSRDNRTTVEPKNQELRDVFQHFDRDGNGTIDPAELKALLEALGGGFTDEEVRIGLHEIDRDGNGKIEFSEFARWWADR